LKPSLLADRIMREVSQYLVGHSNDIKLILASFLVRGHVLIFGLPGSGKTLTAKLISESLGLIFRRIQFTPDILPSDIIGFKTIDPKTGSLRTVKGPIFANIVLGDEINRANPRTLSALIEAMQEGAVSIEGDTHVLPKPFMFIATMNPIEREGIYTLPYAIIDRFSLSIGYIYPNFEEEIEILAKDVKLGLKEPKAEAVVSVDDFYDAIKYIQKVRVKDELIVYLVNLARSIREDDRVSLGPTPRATIHLLRVAKALAAIDGRDYLIPDDIKEAAPHVLRHRLIIKGKPVLLSMDEADEIINRALSAIPPP